MRSSRASDPLRFFARFDCDLRLLVSHFNFQKMARLRWQVLELDTKKLAWKTRPGDISWKNLKQSSSSIFRPLCSTGHVVSHLFCPLSLSLCPHRPTANQPGILPPKWKEEGGRPYRLSVRIHLTRHLSKTSLLPSSPSFLLPFVPPLCLLRLFVASMTFAKHKKTKECTGCTILYTVCVST